MSRIVVSRDLFGQLPSAQQAVDFPLPELGDGVVIPIWPMTAKEWTQFQIDGALKDGKPTAKTKTARERMVIHCCRNDDGTPIFTTADIELIGSRVAGIVERIVNKCQEVSKLTDADIEDAEKN